MLRSGDNCCERSAASNCMVSSVSVYNFKYVLIISFLFFVSVNGEPSMVARSLICTLVEYSTNGIDQQCLVH